MTTLAPPPRQEGARHSHRAAPPADGGFAARAGRLFTGPAEDPRWARPALWAILVLATALYAWNLSSITGNTFYNAAVYSGTKSWKAFFFGALDSGSFITVDKPPFALWVMGLSARVLGFGTWQLMLPMVALGTGSVALLHRMRLLRPRLLRRPPPAAVCTAWTPPTSAEAGATTAGAAAGTYPAAAPPALPQREVNFHR